MHFDHIAAIYNPHSTGNAKKNALELQATLRGHMATDVELIETEYAGHATKLAFELAKNYRQPLILSASGDGGYNEVVNGALRAQAEGAKPTCAVLPSGNANDHATSVQQRPLAELIESGVTNYLDVLQVTMVHDKTTVSRFVHSYVGLGITSVVARELNKDSLNSWRETIILVKQLWNLRPVRIRREDTDSEVDSLVCSLIPRMAKMFTLSKQARPDDGKFEITSLPHGEKWRLIRKMARGVVDELDASSRESDYTFTLLQAAPIQFDGEVALLAANTDMSISLCPGLLRTVAEPAEATAPSS